MVFNLEGGGSQLARACAEVMLAASLIIFLYAYLNLNRWNIHYSHLALTTLILILGLLGVAVWDPSIAAGIARLALAIIGLLGFVTIAVLAFQHYDRAILLIPTWCLLMGLAGGGGDDRNRLSVQRHRPARARRWSCSHRAADWLHGDAARLAGGAIAQGLISDVERKALALTGAGDIIWDWDIDRDRIYTGNEVEDLLNLKRGTLEGPARDWLDILHPQDRDRFRATLDAVIDQRRGKVTQTFRLRSEDGHFRWFRLRARPIIGSDGEVIRCVGTLLDVTEERTAEERLLHDAVHDNLTGLPNRELFVDRLRTSVIRSRAEETSKPTLLVLNLDRFKQVNDSIGLSAGDSILLTVARRLGRLIGQQDTLGRLSGDQYGLVLLSSRSRTGLLRWRIRCARQSARRSPSATAKYL